MMKYVIITILLFGQLLLAEKSEKPIFEDKRFETSLVKASKDISFQNYKGAYRNLELALLYNPENLKGKLYIAIFLAGVKNYISSLTVLLKNPELKKEQIAQFYIFYGYHFISKDLEATGLKQFNESKEYLLKNNDKLGEDKLLFLSVANYANGDKKSSLIFFNKAISKNPNLLSLKYQINFGKDIVYEIYKDLTSPKDIHYYNSLGKMQIKFKENKDAILTLKKGLELEKGNHITKKLLAEANIILKNYDESLKYLLEIKDFFFNNEEVFLLLREIYSHKEDNKKVLLICQKGLSAIPYSEDLRLCVAEAFYKMKSYRKALFNLEYLLSQFPSSSKVNFLVGQVLEDFVKKISLEADGLDFITAENAILKNFDEPMEYYLKAFEFNPIEPRIMKKIFRNLIAKLKDASTDEIALEKMKNKGNESYLQYYEPFVAKETTENNNIEFNKKFVKYINSGLKSKELLKDMKYLPIGKTFLIYLELLSKKEDKELSTKLFDEFMLKYSKKYFEILARKHHFNQFLYYFNFDNHRKNIEQVKVYNFIIPSYFD